MDKTLTLYHGSSLIIERPQFGKGNPFNDYGLGFYCTETLELAKEWACSMEQDGFITRCSVEKDARLKRLNATPKGVAFHERIHATIERFERDLQQGIAPEQQAAARAVLEQVLTNAQELTIAAAKFPPAEQPAPKG